jgi:hypothetical protein
MLPPIAGYDHNPAGISLPTPSVLSRSKMISRQFSQFLFLTKFAYRAEAFGSIRDKNPNENEEILRDVSSEKCERYISLARSIRI